MKKLKFKKREAEPAQIIEHTHATIKKQEKNIEKTKKTKKEDIIYKKRDSKPSKTTSIRLHIDEIEKINKYLEEHNLKFVELIRMLLAEKGIL